LAGKRLENLDPIVCPRLETFTLPWHWAENARHSVKVFGAKGELTVCETTQPAINENNRKFQSQTSVCRQTGKRVEFHTLLVVRANWQIVTFFLFFSAVLVGCGQMNYGRRNN
jgi:hypothetical protein